MKIGSRTLGTVTLLGALLLGCSDGGAPSEEDEAVDSARAGSREGRSTDEDDQSSDTSASTKRDAGSASEANLEAFERPFSALVSNTAKWGPLSVTLKSARVQRGKTEVGYEVGEFAPSPNKTYVELEIDVTNRANTDRDYASRSTWDLILPDGKRISCLPTQEQTLAPQAVVPLTLRYSVDPDIDLAGAVLELNSTSRGIAAPERIPLDQPYTPDIDVEQTALKGKVLEATLGQDFERRRVEIIEARVSRNSLIEGRADFGKMIVELLVDFTPVQCSSGDLALSVIRDFAVVVDGKVSLPINAVNEVVNVGETIRVPIVFSIDDTAKAPLFRAQVGYDLDNSPKAEFATAQLQL